MISERTRIICIVLTIPCIIAVLAEKCMAAGEIERIAARTKAQVQAMNHLGFRPAADISDLPQWQQNILNPSGKSRPAYYEDGNKSYGDSYMATPYHADPPPQVNINQNVQNNITVIVDQPEPYYYPVYRDRSSDRQHFYLHNRNTRR